MTTATSKPLRADAARNRALILEAARAVFRERGLDVSLDDVARRAGVGVGTLYRRFADREQLIEAIFDDRIQEQIVRLEQAVASQDAWSALVAFLESTCQELANDRGMRQMFFGAVRGRDQVARGRDQLHGLIAELVDRARAQGRLRDGFAPTDIPLLLLMISTVSDFATDISPELWRRYFTVYIEGLRARPDQRPLAPGLLPEQMDQAMSAWQPARC